MVNLLTAICLCKMSPHMLCVCNNCGFASLLFKQEFPPKMFLLLEWINRYHASLYICRNVCTIYIQWTVVWYAVLVCADKPIVVFFRVKMAKYKVTVHTHNIATATTMNNVFIKLVGEKGESKRTWLTSLKGGFYQGTVSQSCSYQY